MAVTKLPVTIKVREMVIPPETKLIGVAGDQNAEEVTIILPRKYQRWDLSQYVLIVDVLTPKGQLFDTANPTRTVTEDEIRLVWTVGPIPASENGEVLVRIRAVGLEYVWQSKTGTFTVAETFTGSYQTLPPTISYFDTVLLQVAGMRDQSAISAAASAQSAARAQQEAERARQEADRAETAAGIDLLDLLTVPTSSTGPIATLEGVIPGRPLHITTHLVATQEGEGEPSPGNRRPIVGKSAVNVPWGGKNLYRTQYPGRQNNGVTYTVNDDGSISASGTASANSWASASFQFGSPYLVYVPPGTYTVSGGLSTDVSIYAVAFRPNGTQYTTQYGNGKAISLAFPDGAYYYVQIQVKSGITVDATLHIQLELGPTATPYEPYQGNTYPVTLPKPMYGLKSAPVEVRSDGTIINPTGNIPSYNGEEIPGEYESSTGGLDIGSQIVYVLPTPEVLTIAPFTIPAPNSSIVHVWSDGGGETTVTGRLSPAYAQARTDARIAALEALVTQP